MNIRYPAAVALVAISSACGATELSAPPPNDLHDSSAGSGPDEPQDGAVGGDATRDGGTGDDGAPLADGGVEAGRVVLLAAGTSGLAVFNDAHTLAASRAPDALSPESAYSVAVVGRRVFVARNGRIERFDDGTTLTSATAPSGSRAWPEIQSLVPAGSDSLLALDRTGIHLLPDVSRLDALTVPKATFVHESHQVMFAAYESSSDRVYGGQISGAGGLLGWTAASARWGRVESDIRVAEGGFIAGTIDGNRLYAGGTLSPTWVGVLAWPDAASLGEGAPYVSSNSGYAPGGAIGAVAARNGVLAVASRGQNVVFVYRDAAALTPGRAADFVLSRPELGSPTCLVFDRTGRLYIGDEDGVVVYDHPATAPSFVANLTGLGRVSGLTTLE